MNFHTHYFDTEYLADAYAWITWPYYLICRRRSILKIVKKLHFDLWPLKVGSYDKITIDFFKALIIVYKMA